MKDERAICVQQMSAVHVFRPLDSGLDRLTVHHINRQPQGARRIRGTSLWRMVGVTMVRLGSNNSSNNENDSSCSIRFGTEGF
jgi:hypothetical protein